MSELRKAAETALEVFDGPVLKDATEHAMRLRKACDLLRQALAQPEQEPVAYVTIENISSWAQVPSIKWFKKPTEGPLYTAPVDAVNISQERVDETAKSKHEPWQSVQCTCGGTIYFKHTKREWVGISEKEVAWLWFSMGNREGINGYDFAKAIESKLKERNNG